MKIKIDPGFKSLCPALSEFEFKQLHESIVADGCRDPLVIWKGKGVLVDGHNRFEICEMNGVEFKVVERKFDSREDVENWIILNQLGRRNLSPDAAAILRGKLYQASKKEVGAPDGNQNNRSESQFRNSCGVESTAEKIADKTGVSPRTVENDAAFTAAADKIGITADVMSGKMKPVRKQVIAAAAELPENPTDDQVSEAVRKVTEKKPKHPKKKATPKKEKPDSGAMNCAWSAVHWLQEISKNDPERQAAFDHVQNFINENR